MTVYVDYSPELAGHRMIADSDAELHEMADRLGIEREWCRGDQYSISPLQRPLAVKYGAVRISAEQCNAMLTFSRAGLPMPAPREAVERFYEMRAQLQLAAVWAEIAPTP